MRTLAEISEAEATGEIAALYVKIRANTGSNLVNYIWRHLATIEGAAPFAWDFTQVNDSADLAALIAAEADAAATDLAPASRAADAFVLNGIARDIVTVYNANNADNLARVMLLRSALVRQPSDGRSGSEKDVVASPSVLAGRDTQLPPLPAFADLSEPEQEAIEAVADAGPASDSGLIPSLWRHLAVCDGLIERLAPALVTLLRSAPFHEQFGALRMAAAATADAQPTVLPVIPGGLDRDRVFDGIDRFSRRITELTIAGRVVAAWSTR